MGRILLTDNEYDIIRIAVANGLPNAHGNTPSAHAKHTALCIIFNPDLKAAELNESRKAVLQAAGVSEEALKSPNGTLEIGGDLKTVITKLQAAQVLTESQADRINLEINAMTGEQAQAVSR